MTGHETRRWRRREPWKWRALLPLVAALGFGHGCIEGASFQGGDTSSPPADTGGLPDADTTLPPRDTASDSAIVDGPDAGGAHPDVADGAGDGGPHDVPSFEDAVDAGAPDAERDVDRGDVDAGPSSLTRPALHPAFVTGRSRGGGLVLRALGAQHVVVGASRGGGLRIRSAPFVLPASRTPAR